MFSYRNYTFNKFWREYTLIVLVLANALVWLVLYQSREITLKVYFLDVGQGDAILVDTPSHKQLLIDGGRNKQIVSELGKILPFGDRILDVVIATHPDADHIGGLPEVVSRYDVGLLLESGVESENKIDDELDRRAVDKGVRKLLARRGMRVSFGDGVVLRILFPDRDVTRWETNDASIVARLDYGESSFLFTGDSPIKIENTLINYSEESKELLDVDVLKVGHHGSRTSTSLSYAQTVSPEYAVISAGKGNRYGHPHKEVLEILSKVGTKVVSTMESGTIKFETDGKTLEADY